MVSKRISLIAKLAKDAKVLVDVGCDHGYTSLEVFKLNDNLEHAYLLDINKLPLEQAKKTFSNTIYNDKVSYHLSNGLADFNNDFDTMIISGMGGSIISEILDYDAKKLYNKKLILEPQGNINLVRRWLYCNGFDIINEEELVERNKYYNIIVAAKSEVDVSYNILDINYGKHLRNKCSDIFLDYYKKQYLNFKEIKESNYKIKEKLIELDYIINKKDFIKHQYNSGYYTELIVNDSNNYFIVFPGGGYHFTSEREAEVIGLYLNSIGYNALVFYYLGVKYHYQNTYLDVSRAINNYFKDLSKYNLYYIGFSAGAHLALELSNHLDYYNLNGKGVVCAYPLVLSDYGKLEKELYHNLIPNCNEQILKRLSEELEVNSKSLPLFVFTTLNDELVDSYHTLALVKAYQKANLKCECHIFKEGIHGLSLATKDSARVISDINTDVSRWFDLLINYLKNK